MILIGKTIASIELAKDQKAIKFNLSDGSSIVAKTDGDCCSESWIESIDNPEALIGSPVLAVEDISMAELPRDEDCDLTQCYGCKIRTANGEAFMEYRNTSNGYYGGSLYWPGEEYDYFYGGVFGQNISKEEWYPIAGSLKLED